MIKVGLFIPCYVDQLYPQVGMATLKVLEKFKVDVDYPLAQTCCGQPMANAGCTAEAAPLAEKFYRIFKDYPYVVCPSGSCTSMVRNHYEEYLKGRPGFEELKKKTFELCEFLTEVLKVEKIEGHFPYKIGLHQSCHGLRELRLANSSERMIPPFNKIKPLLASLEGISFAELSRPDECCGFGGTFAISEEAISCMMGKDRIADHENAGTEVLTGVDMSCLMHLEGLLRRAGKSIRVMHIAEILQGVL